MASTRREGRTPSQRQLRVGEELRHALAGVLGRGEMRDPGLEDVPITVTEVRMSPDLRNATVFITPLGGGEVQAVIEALIRARPFLRRRVAQVVRLKYVPDLAFRADQSFDEAERIAALLDAGGDDEEGGQRGP